ncbi:MAG: DUF2264 domain-containing protein [Bacteroidota bacterium]|nr:DUF2264 domain-containing protein [Bacteroidota bacterium]
MKKIVSFICFCFFSVQLFSQSPDRQFWLEQMDKLAKPVIFNLAQNRLKEVMPVALSPVIDNAANRKKVAYLEAFARTLCGIAPWLNLEGGSQDEIKLRNQYRQWALQAVANAVNPNAKDYLYWEGGQPLVDASFLALSFIRSPWLWQHLDSLVKRQVVTVFKITRNTVPVYSNWILFSGMIETFFHKYGMDYDKVRIEYCVREFAEHWYTGDGMFSDGMNFHMDYYNSYVIQPFLAVIIETMKGDSKTCEAFAGKLTSITQRYAVIQERNINTDGSFPVIGRSVTYRAGAFHHLADMALRKQLPQALQPAQVRCALTAVIKKTLSVPGTYNKSGWLTIGLSGSQPGLADVYITGGSLYLTSLAFLPLGLPDTDEFWSAPARPWTSVKVWSGQDIPVDHAIDLK